MPNKIDSNRTGLAFAEETVGLPKTLPGSPIWYGLEPNSYKDFGGEFKQVARDPINPSRQRQKGTLTDLDASGGYNEDLTQNNQIRLARKFLFAVGHEPPSTQPYDGTQVPITSVDGSSNFRYNAASGLGGFLAKTLVYASGFTNSANNGLKKVASSASTNVTIGSGVVAEASPPAAAKLIMVGVEFDSGDATLAKTTAVAAVAAAAVLTITSAENAADGEQVVVGNTVYTFRDTLALPYDVLIGADRSETGDNFAAAINGSAGEGTLYGTGTDAHVDVTAANAAGVITITARVAGAAGNDIDALENGAELAFDNDTLTGGVDGSGSETLTFVTSSFDLTTLPLYVGQWTFVGGDAAGTQFAGNSPGYARILSIAAHAVVFDKTTWVPSTDAGVGKTIRLFFGKFLRNELDPDLIVAGSVQLERQLGNDGDGVQSEYLPGSFASELTINIPKADKLTVDYSFMSMDYETRTGVTGVKSGTRVSALGENAFNTSRNVYRMRMAVLDPDTLNPTPLFGYITEGKITINNNLSVAKAVSVFGGFDVTAGTFEVNGSATAYFTSVAATSAIRDYSDVTMDFILAARNAGIVYDLGLIGLGGGKLTIEKDQPVMMPLTTPAYQCPQGYTLGVTYFDYLPTAAMPA